MAKIHTLTDVQLRAWLTARTPRAASDGSGLTFTISANGAAAWVLRYRFGGRRRELSLGRYPDVTLGAARKLAAQYRVEVGQGVDVAQEKQRKKRMQADAWSVRELTRDYYTKAMPLLAPSTVKCRRGYLDNDMLPRFGSAVARDITEDDAQAWLESISVQRSWQAAENARKAAAALYKYGRARRVVTNNPFVNIDMRTVGVRQATRQRVKLEDGELAVFLQQLDRLAEADALALQLLLVTGVRIGELLGAQWSEFDLEAGRWRIPRDRIKTRKYMRTETFDITLPDVAVGWLQRLQALAAGSPWVLPARARRSPTPQPVDHEALLLRLQRYVRSLDGACRMVTLHDLRSTMRSHLSTMGVRYEVAERALNHRLVGLAEVYDRNDYEVERAAALDAWARKLGGLKDGIQDNVVPLRRAS